MGQRITVGQLIEWLKKFDGSTSVAFLVDNKCRNGDYTGNAYELTEITERPISGSCPQAGDTTLFLGIK